MLEVAWVAGSSVLREKYGVEDNEVGLVDIQLASDVDGISVHLFIR